MVLKRLLQCLVDGRSFLSFSSLLTRPRSQSSSYLRPSAGHQRDRLRIRRAYVRWELTTPKSGKGRLVTIAPAAPSCFSTSWPNAVGNASRGADRRPRSSSSARRRAGRRSRGTSSASGTGSAAGPRRPGADRWLSAVPGTPGCPVRSPREVDDLSAEGDRVPVTQADPAPTRAPRRRRLRAWAAPDGTASGARAGTRGTPRRK
jgi:hypothetical protein